MSNGNGHLSIGEVLSELREEFPDITISKIRFLESQGLIDPERTPSGYRKFYDDDLVRLRWILHQQKVNFLPLKVIKERLDQLPPGSEALLDPSPVQLAEPVEPSVAARGRRPAGAEAGSPEHEAATSRRGRQRRLARRQPALAPTVPADDPATVEPLFIDTPAAADEPAPEAGHSRMDVAHAAGITPEQVFALEEFGLLSAAWEQHGEPQYDDDALEIATVAAGFLDRGVEARHLRMYRTFAERESALFSQVLLAYQRQRNPEARARLQDELVELASLGRRLRTVLLRDAVRESLAE
jgi:DNA-binding transcriptional MerR regulator